MALTYYENLYKSKGKISSLVMKNNLLMIQYVNFVVSEQFVEDNV